MSFEQRVNSAMKCGELPRHWLYSSRPRPIETRNSCVSRPSRKARISASSRTSGAWPPSARARSSGAEVFVANGFVNWSVFCTVDPAVRSFARGATSMRLRAPPISKVRARVSSTAAESMVNPALIQVGCARVCATIFFTILLTILLSSFLCNFARSPPSPPSQWQPRARRPRSSSCSARFSSRGVRTAAPTAPSSSVAI